VSTRESSLVESEEEDTEEWRRRRRRRRKRHPESRGIDSSDFSGLSTSTVPEELTAAQGEGGEGQDLIARLVATAEGARSQVKAKAVGQKGGWGAGNQRWSHRIRARSLDTSGQSVQSFESFESGQDHRSRASGSRLISDSEPSARKQEREDSVARTRQGAGGALYCVKIPEGGDDGGSEVNAGDDGGSEVNADLLQDSEISSGWVGGVSESEQGRSSVGSVGAVRRRRGKEKEKEEPKVYGGGYLRPEKAEWTVPCDMIGCDGVQCKQFERWEKQHDKWRIGQLVRTPDGDGQVIDKDVSARPLRVRLEDGMEGWYTWKEVKDLAKIRSRKKLSSSLFGFGAASSGADSEALSQSAAKSQP